MALLCLFALADAEGILSLDLAQAHVDEFVAGGGHVLAHEIGADGHFPAAAVAKNEQHDLTN